MKFSSHHHDTSKLVMRGQHGVPFVNQEVLKLLYVCEARFAYRRVAARLELQLELALNKSS